MGYVRSRKFCCCIPVRFGAFIMSMLYLVVGIALAAASWYGTRHLDDLHFTKKQEVSLYITAVSWTLLALISLFGLIGTIIRNKSYVSAYSTLVWLHLGVSIATGAFFMYNLFHRSGDTESDAISSCESKNGDDHDTCKKAFELARGIIVALLVVFWLLELWGCLIVADYLGQMDEEDESRQVISPMFVGGESQPASMPTTFAPNYGAQYAFNAAENSHDGGYYKGNDV